MLVLDNIVRIIIIGCVWFWTCPTKSDTDNANFPHKTIMYNLHTGVSCFQIFSGWKFNFPTEYIACTKERKPSQKISFNFQGVIHKSYEIWNLDFRNQKEQRTNSIFCLKKGFKVST